MILGITGRAEMGVILHVLEGLRGISWEGDAGLEGSRSQVLAFESVRHHTSVTWFAVPH